MGRVGKVNRKKWGPGRIISLLIAILLMLNQLAVTSYAEIGYDTASSWAVKELLEAELDGFIPEKFYEDFGKVITRDEFSNVVIRLYNEMGSGMIFFEENPFIDTESQDAIAAYSLGIVNGISEDRFAPLDNITREQVCVMLVRTIKASGIRLKDVSEYPMQADYLDTNTVSSWAIDEVTIMNNLEIFNGTGDNLDPLGTLTREQAILLVERTFKLNDQLVLDSKSTLTLDQLVEQPEGFTFVEETIRTAEELGYAVPTKPEKADTYVSKESDLITVDASLTGELCYESVVHKGFSGNEVMYDVLSISWMDFFGDLTDTMMEKELVVQLKGNDVYEFEYVDKYEQHVRYYKDENRITYQVNEMWYGNFTDDESELTFEKDGFSIINQDIEILEKPSYNSFSSKYNDSINECFVTVLNNEPVIYLEIIKEENIYQKFISIDKGVVVKEVKFNSEGLSEYEKTLSYYEAKTIEDSVFNHPTDIEYEDLTLFIYSWIQGDDFNYLVQGIDVINYEEPFSINMKVNNDQDLTLYAEGFEDSLLNPLFVTKTTDMNDLEVTLRSFNDGQRYTSICPEKEVVEKYASSSAENKLFDFVTTSFISYISENGYSYYEFKDNGKGSVSGLESIYEYVVNESNGELEKINRYSKEYFYDDQVIGQVTEYTIESIGEFDATLYEYPDSYEIYDHGDKSHDDGEHAPYWFY